MNSWLGTGTPVHGIDISLSFARPGPPIPTWTGDQIHRTDEIWRGCWCIADCSWNAESPWCWKGPWLNRGYHHPLREDSYRMEREYHHLPLQGQRRRSWARKLSRPQIDRPVMKVLQSVVENFLRQQVRTDGMQFGFMPGRNTTDAIFIVHQLHEKFHAVNEALYMTIVNLELAFDRVPRRVIWWVLHKLGIEEYLVHLIQNMCENGRNRVRSEWRVQCESGYSPRLLFEPPTLHGSLTWKIRDFRSTWAKPRSSYLG